MLRFRVYAVGRLPGGGKRESRPRGSPGEAAHPPPGAPAPPRGEDPPSLPGSGSEPAGGGWRHLRNLLGAGSTRPGRERGALAGLEGPGPNPALPLTPCVTLGSPSSRRHVGRRPVFILGALGPRPQGPAVARLGQDRRIVSGVGTA